MVVALALRPIGKNDCAVIDGGNVVSRIRHAAEHTNDIWGWNVTVLITGPPCGHAGDLEPAKAGYWPGFCEVGNDHPRK